MKTFTITIDVEPDTVSGTWKTSDPISFDGVFTGVKTIQHIANQCKSYVTYFVQPVVLYTESCVEFFKKLDGHFEIGTHLHGEYIEPHAKFSHKDGFGGCDPGEMQRNYSPKVEFRKLRNLTNLFRDSFGYGPLSFRAGRFGSSKDTCKFLKELGYTHDSSMVVGSKLHPRLNSVSAFKIDDIVEVPVTVGPSKKWLRPTPGYSSRNEIEKLVEWLNQYENVNACCMFHNVEVIPGKNPYCLTVDSAKQMCDDFQFTIECLKRNGYESVAVNKVKCY